MDWLKSITSPRQYFKFVVPLKRRRLSQPACFMQQPAWKYDISWRLRFGGSFIGEGMLLPVLPEASAHTASATVPSGVLKERNGWRVVSAVKLTP